MELVFALVGAVMLVPMIFAGAVVAGSIARRE